MIPEGATFRRAEGLWITVAPCRGLDEVIVTARRQDGDVATAVSRAQLRLLSRMRTWQTPAELGVDVAEVTALVDAHLVFWSRGRPTQALTAAPVAGANALRDNVVVTPLVARGGLLGAFPGLPRLGELDDAALAGVRFEIVEWEAAVATITFACCRRHAAALRGLVAGEPTSPELLAIADDLGLRDRHTPPAWDGAARVTWLGHAGLLYEAHGRRLVIDPPALTRSEPTRHAPRPYDLRDLGPLDAVLITHGDTDHIDPSALVRIPRATPVYVPRAVAPRPYHVDMRRVLDLLGFERVVELGAWERVGLGDVTVIAAPYAGEDWGLGDLPCRTYAVTSPSLTIFANADSITDPDACDRLGRELSIDLAFVGVGGACESHVMPPGFGYGHFYAPWIPPERADEWTLLSNGPAEAADVARRLRARHAFGYAAGGLPAYSLGYSDRGTHADLAALLRDGDPRAVTLEIGVPWSAPRSPSGAG